MTPLGLFVLSVLIPSTAALEITSGRKSDNPPLTQLLSNAEASGLQLMPSKCKGRIYHYL